MSSHSGKINELHDLAKTSDDNLRAAADVVQAQSEYEKVDGVTAEDDEKEEEEVGDEEVGDDEGAKKQESGRHPPQLNPLASSAPTLPSVQRAFMSTTLY
jgi:hypothetical protein